MKQWRPARPQFTEPVLLFRSQDGTATGRGSNRTGTKVARVLRALQATSVTDVPDPIVDPPLTNRASPGDYGGWRAWWPPPPDETRSGTYTIPDPPTVERPVEPTSENPILWEAFGEVGSTIWEKRVSGFFVRGEWTPTGGTERIQGMMELAINTGRLKVRPAALRRFGVESKSWIVKMLADDTEWGIEAIVASYRRGQFAELILQSRGNQ